MMATVGRITFVEDQSNKWIINRLVKAELVLHDLPEKRDRRRVSELSYAIAEHAITNCREELANRRDPSYVQRRRALVAKTYGVDDPGIEVVT